MDWGTITASWDWALLSTILGVNLVLSGDNAVLIALAAAGLPPEQRGKAILFGMVLAVVLRIILSLGAVYLLAIPGILLAGGLVLLWIAYGFFKELRQKEKDDADGHVHDGPPKTMAVALRQIVVADVSMSLDNVLAVAGAAVGNTPMLIIGLIISILVMGVAATLIAKLLERFPIIAWVGLALIVYIGVKMIYEDVHRLTSSHAATVELGQAAPPPHGALVRFS
jgi:YjbE family integral membrane protein